MQNKENEITVKVISKKGEIIKILADKGFKKCEEFSLDDYFLVPKNIDIEHLSARDILSKAIIIRQVNRCGKINQDIVFKRKNIDENGNILSQNSINCGILNVDDAKKLFEAIEYSQIMNIKEDDIVYNKEKFELTLKFVHNSDVLIEIETKENSKWDTIDKIKKVINELDLPIERGNFFIKKAENELNKILKRK